MHNRPPRGPGRSGGFGRHPGHRQPPPPPRTPRQARHYDYRRHRGCGGGCCLTGLFSAIGGWFLHLFR